MHKVATAVAATAVAVALPHSGCAVRVCTQVQGPQAASAAKYDSQQLQHS